MSVRNVAALGTLVVKSALALPATATGTIVTQSGGSVLVTGLLGVVTTATGATVTTVSLGTVVASGGSNTSITAATTITSLTAGTWLLPVSNNTPAAMTIKANGAAFLTASGDRLFTPFVLATGSGITWTTSATDTGNITWYVWYIPIDADSGLS